MKQLFDPRRSLTIYAIVCGIAALALLYIPALQPIHTPGLTAIAIGAAIIIAQLEYRRRKAENVLASLNGRLLKLTSALTELRIFLKGTTFKALPGKERQRLRQIENDLGNLVTVIQGFRDLDEYIREVAARAKPDA